MKMLMLLFIVVFFTVGHVTSVTDEEFQKLKDLMDYQGAQLSQQGAQLAQQGALLNQQIFKNDHQDQVIFDQAVEIAQLKQALVFLPTNSDKNNLPTENLSETFQNITLEERVSLLELQMTETRGDINGIEQNIGFLEDEQFLQDQRIFNLEEDVDLVSQDILDLQATTLTLDYRVTSLEENGGGNANITQLETRVTELEILTVDQGISIDINEEDIQDLEATTITLDNKITNLEDSVGNTNLTQLELKVSELEILTVDQGISIGFIEEDIQGLQSSDAALDSRVTALEENNGGGGGNNETSIAFFAVYPDSTIPFDTNVLFRVVLVNDEDGYNPSTGTFTVPPGGDGLYYFSTYLLVYNGEAAYFNIRVNGVRLCTAYGDDNNNGGDLEQATCSGLAQLTEGDEVSLVYDNGSDTSPLVRSSTYHYNGFSGFRL